MTAVSMLRYQFFLGLGVSRVKYMRSAVHYW